MKLARRHQNEWRPPPHRPKVAAPDGLASESCRHGHYRPRRTRRKARLPLGFCALVPFFEAIVEAHSECRSVAGGAAVSWISGGWKEIKISSTPLPQLKRTEIPSSVRSDSPHEPMAALASESRADGGSHGPIESEGRWADSAVWLVPPWPRPSNSFGTWQDGWCPGTAARPPRASLAHLHAIFHGFYCKQEAREVFKWQINLIAPVNCNLHTLCYSFDMKIKEVHLFFRFPKVSVFQKWIYLNWISRLLSLELANFVVCFVRCW